MPSLHLLALGDSKTEGESWVSTLKTQLETDYAWTWGSSMFAAGSTTLAWGAANAASIASEVPAGAAGEHTYVLVNWGVNEMASMPAKAVWKADYFTIIDAIVAKQPGAFIYCVKPWYRGKDAEALTMAGWVDEIVAERPNNARVGHNEAVWLKGSDNGSTMTYDGVHYSAAGQTECVNQWLALLPWAQKKPVAGTARSIPTRLFPVDNWWNLRVDTAPLDTASTHYILGTPASFPVDPNDFNYRGFGVGPDYTYGPRSDFGDNYGFPFCTVSKDYPKVRFVGAYYWSNCDDVPYPIPIPALTVPGWTEDGEGTISVPVLIPGDRHVLIVDIDNNRLYEIYQPFYNNTAGDILIPDQNLDYNITLHPGEFYCSSCCNWDLNSNTPRTEGWTSTDAAGLQILPGLLQYDELLSPNPITHAFRTYVATASYEQPHYVWPATHEAGNYLRGMPPLGARFRLKASFDLTTLNAYPNVKKVATAFRDYGTIVADNGGHGMISGNRDDRWGNYESAIRAEFVAGFALMKWTDFEMVQLGWDPGTTPPVPTQAVTPTPGAFPAGQIILV